MPVVTWLGLTQGEKKEPNLRRFWLVSPEARETERQPLKRPWQPAAQHHAVTGIN